MIKRFFLSTLILLSGILSLGARVFMTQQDALKLAFPLGGSVERKTIFLTEIQHKEIERRAQSKLTSLLVTYYVGVSTEGFQQTVFFDTHGVRTMPETLMAVVGRDGHIRSVEILSFNEPEDYLPPKRWFGLFQGKTLDDQLWVNRGLRHVAGATLSTNAVSESVRRILSIYQVAVEPTLNKGMSK